MSRNAVPPCERCAAPTVAIELLSGDAAMTMRSCSRCDHRTWERADDGDRTRLPDVLAKVSERSSKRRSA